MLIYVSNCYCAKTKDSWLNLFVPNVQDLGELKYVITI